MLADERSPADLLAPPLHLQQIDDNVTRYPALRLLAYYHG